MTRKSKTGGQSGQTGEAGYRVGYGRPPKATQFKPNQSGNPTGRPRRIPTLGAVVEKVLEERIEIREGERVLRMSNRQALVRTAVRRALNGDPKLLRALSHVLRLETEGNQAETAADKAVSAADEAILANFIARLGADNSGAVEGASEPKSEPPKPSPAGDSERNQS